MREAIDLQVGFQGILGAEDLAEKAGDLAAEAKARGILTIKRASIALPDGLEGKIRRETIMVGGKTREQLRRELKTPPFRLSDYTEDLMNRAEELDTPGEPEPIELIFPRVREMGLTGIQTTDQIYQRGLDLGWNLCSRKVGPYLRTQDPNQPLGDVYWIAMKQITGRDGHPRVFGLRHDDDDLWLDGRWMRPTHRWGPGGRLVFSLGK